MFASLLSLFGDTEKYNSTSGPFIGIVIMLIGLIITLTLYSMYIVDDSYNEYPKRKEEHLKTIIVGGFAISLLLAYFIGSSINRYHFCQTNQDICVLDYSFSPFA